MDAQVGESSACATALLCGVKANLETVGLDVRGKFGNCSSSFVSRVESLVDWAQQEGKFTYMVIISTNGVGLAFRKHPL